MRIRGSKEDHAKVASILLVVCSRQVVRRVFGDTDSLLKYGKSLAKSTLLCERNGKIIQGSKVPRSPLYSSLRKSELKRTNKQLLTCWTLVVRVVAMLVCFNHAVYMNEPAPTKQQGLKSLKRTMREKDVPSTATASATAKQGSTALKANPAARLLLAHTVCPGRLADWTLVNFATCLSLLSRALAGCLVRLPVNPLTSFATVLHIRATGARETRRCTAICTNLLLTTLQHFRIQLTRNGNE